MVAWEAAPYDTMWAKAAWEDLGLSPDMLGSECIMIPDNMTPDPTRAVGIPLHVVELHVS